MIQYKITKKKATRGTRPVMRYCLSSSTCLPVLWFGVHFDTDNSEFVLALKEHGFKVVHSHIMTGQDFFKYEPEHWDIIVSNPPFGNKMEIFERCLSFGKPFALLMSNMWLNDTAPCRLFEDKELQLLLFDRRVQYNRAGDASRSVQATTAIGYCRSN